MRDSAAAKKKKDLKDGDAILSGNFDVFITRCG